MGGLISTHDTSRDDGNDILILPDGTNAVASHEIVDGIRDGTLTLHRATDLLVNEGASAHCIVRVGKGSRSPIQLAIEHHRTADSVAILRLLIERGGPDINYSGDGNLWDPPVRMAIRCGRYDLVNLLLDCPDAQLRELGLLWCVAFYARGGAVSAAEKLAMVKRLVRVGGVALIREGGGPGNALHWFCRWPLADPSAQMELIAYLEHKAGRPIVDEMDSAGRTPLFLAYESHSLASVRLLLRKGASITAAGVTPEGLREAGRVGQEEIRWTRAIVYCGYLRRDFPRQVSIPVKTALLPIRALTSTRLPADVIARIAQFTLAPRVRVVIPIGERFLDIRINRLANDCVSAVYHSVRETGGPQDIVAHQYADLMREIRRTASNLEFVLVADRRGSSGC
ncbi:unnamed protein product [Vitrella brassicaformis CCMP3155]|uniref:Uncharacterized protein n=1 Tax=Vitrella brassicaformis (strain CCMP3155) TaxID=1169540 RepID=A0A0G4G2X1_VITBC|nr:unnamed protein product [Vitrella brassicaformis CCMP3155]|eukprot:CEM22059.1 unnamed protein product [Vitrella brassicaformis CCMP3155]